MRLTCEGLPIAIDEQAIKVGSERTHLPGKKTDKLGTHLLIAPASLVHIGEIDGRHRLGRLLEMRKESLYKLLAAEVAGDDIALTIDEHGSGD